MSPLYLHNKIKHVHTNKSSYWTIGSHLIHIYNNSICVYKYITLIVMIYVITKNNHILCSTTHIIVLFTCTTCQMQYVEKTKQAPWKCMYNHNSALKGNKRCAVLCQYYFICNYFHESKTWVINVKVEIIY